jgi:hypothetical protein
MLCFTGLALLNAFIYVIKSYDIVLTEIISNLHFDQLQRTVARVL